MHMQMHDLWKSFEFHMQKIYEHLTSIICARCETHMRGWGLAQDWAMAWAWVQALWYVYILLFPQTAFSCRVPGSFMYGSGYDGWNSPTLWATKIIVNMRRLLKIPSTMLCKINTLSIGYRLCRRLLRPEA